ncbi:MAG: hypothetical protein A3H27_07935 [Acidobacteria bacterium RIFCSPLOWO2_02_FULL_59_13]|nr:MAG: hypothetical protein A3H27_07935 [Acidobacteria bacterium RIFCSPLOWO2_02_FULL_59_13]
MESFQYGRDFTGWDVGSGDWKCLTQMIYPRVSSAAEKFLKLLQTCCKTVVCEKNYIDLDYRAGYSRFYYLRHHDTERRCTRLHFFSRNLTESDLHDATDEVAGGYLGYSVLRPLPDYRLGRTIFSEKLLPEGRDKTKSYLTCKANYRVNLAGNDFEVTGAPWMQQDTLVSACASIAIWVASWHMSHKHWPEFRRYDTAEITDLATQDNLSTGRSMPSEGLYPDQMMLGLNLMGYEPLPYDPSTADEARNRCYYYIESGIPVIFGLYFPGIGGHAVTGVGHTLDENYSTEGKKPRAWEDSVDSGTGILEFWENSQFVPAFVVQDDAGGPFRFLEIFDYNDDWNKCFSEKLQQKVAECARQWRCIAVLDRGTSLEQICFLTYVIVPLPLGVTLDGRAAEMRALSLLQAWYADTDRQPRSPLVVRTFLQLSNAVKRSCTKRDMPPYIALNIRRHLMSKWVWVTEFADLEELKARKLVFGQVIQDCASHANSPDFFDLLLFNIPDPPTLILVHPDGTDNWEDIGAYGSYKMFLRDMAESKVAHP